MEDTEHALSTNEELLSKARATVSLGFDACGRFARGGGAKGVFLPRIVLRDGPCEDLIVAFAKGPPYLFVGGRNALAREL